MAKNKEAHIRINAVEAQLLADLLGKLRPEKGAGKSLVYKAKKSLLQKLERNGYEPGRESCLSGEVVHFIKYESFE